MSEKSVKKIIQRRFVIVGILVLTVIISFIGGSYSWNKAQAVNGEYNYFKEDNFELSYIEGENGYANVLSLVDEKPISDKEGSQRKPYRFNITNTDDKELNYVLKISFDDAYIDADGCKDKLLSTRYIKYKIDNEKPKTLYTVTDKDYEIYVTEESIMPGSSKIHELRIWIDENSPEYVLNKHFHGVVKVETINKSEVYKEFFEGQEVELLNGQKFYVLNNSNKTNSKVSLISKYNISKNGVQDINYLPMTYSDTYKVLNTKYLVELKDSLKEYETKIDNIVVKLPEKDDLKNDKNYLSKYSIWTQSMIKNTTYILKISDNKYSLVQENINSNKYGLRPIVIIDKNNIK